jgi:hypothetical protein
MLVDPTLVATVLGGVDGGDQRRVEATREMVAGHGHQPVVPVDEVEIELVPEVDPRREHVRVHALDPGDELTEVGGALRLQHPVDLDPAHDLLGRRLLTAAGEHMDLGVERGEVLRELAHVAGQPALDQRRVLPGEDQDAVHGSDLDR